MRHLEKITPTSIRSNLIKKDCMDHIIEIKEELPNLILQSCDNLIKNNEYVSDEEMDIIHESSDSNEDDCDTNNVIKPRNRRKLLIPQRAVQLDESQAGSLENSLESTQDLSEHLEFNFNLNNSNEIDNLLLSDNENGLDLADEDLLENIKECDIFKNLQEEAEAEKLNDEMLDDVKEEWRAHWGVKCNRCERVFPFKTEFDKHYTETYNLHPVYTCSFCNKTAEKYSTFRSHCYRHITEGRYKCQECPKGFSLQSMLHLHVLAKHTKSKPFICDECGRSFVTKPGLKVHLKKHKTEIKEDYPCVECGKVLHTRGGLTSHMNVHRLGRRFMCDVCGKTFTQKVNMQQHVKQHTGDKPHECDKCGKTFAERSHLARHYSFHSDQRPFKCEVCQKMYKTERCLKVHSLVHAANRPFVCDYCKKGFLSSTKLKQHCNIHTGERPFQCKYCERTFTNYPNWLKHTRRRHKVDHRTGEQLETTLPKEEVQNNFGQLDSIATTTPPTTESSEQLLADISFSRNDELLLQQGLINFPLSELSLPQIDVLGTSNNTVGLLVPYFQSPLQNHQQFVQQTSTSTVPLQFCDFVHSQYLH